MGMKIRQVLLYVLASAALLATGIMAGEPPGDRSGPCHMAANPHLLCDRPATPP